jgi:predicted RNase H-like HicB family nuclease
MTTPRYPIIVSWSDEDQVWVADAPDLKSCSAFGDTAEQAVAELEMAVSAWLESARQAGHALPQPSTAVALLAAE